MELKKSDFCKTEENVLFTLHEAAKYIEVTEYEMRKIAKSLDFPKRRNGRQVVVERQELDKWLKEHTKKSNRLFEVKNVKRELKY